MKWEGSSGSEWHNLQVGLPGSMPLQPWDVSSRPLHPTNSLIQKLWCTDMSLEPWRLVKDILGHLVGRPQRILRWMCSSIRRLLIDHSSHPYSMLEARVPSIVSMRWLGEDSRILSLLHSGLNKRCSGQLHAVQMYGLWYDGPITRFQGGGLRPLPAVAGLQETTVSDPLEL